MKRKTIILAVVAAAAMALSLVGCGVKITNIAVPESAMVEKGESITLPVVYGTDDAPAVTPETAATGESAAANEKVAKAAEKLTIEWTSSDESVATVDETGTVTAVAAGEANVTASVKRTPTSPRALTSKLSSLPPVSRHLSLLTSSLMARTPRTWTLSWFPQTQLMSKSSHTSPVMNLLLPSMKPVR